MTVQIIVGRLVVADGLSITYDSTEHDKLIAKLLARVQRPKRLINAIARYTNAITMQMFRGRRADTVGKRGQKWPKLAKSTIEQKRALKRKGRAIQVHRPLVRTGKLRDSLKVIERKEKGFVYGTRARSAKGALYGGIHNKGGKRGRPPQRKWLFFTRHDTRQMVKMIVDYLENKLKRYNRYVSK